MMGADYRIRPLMPLANASGPSPRLYALVPCAGVGVRAGAPGPKQYAHLAGKSLVAHTLDALAEVGRLSGVLVVLSPMDTAFEAHAPGFGGWVAREGGATLVGGRRGCRGRRPYPSALRAAVA